LHVVAVVVADAGVGRFVVVGEDRRWLVVGVQRAIRVRIFRRIAVRAVAAARFYVSLFS